MATLTRPTPEQLSAARVALLSLVLPYRDASTPSALWRAAHAALCAVEGAMELEPTVPPREVKRRGEGMR